MEYIVIGFISLVCISIILSLIFVLFSISSKDYKTQEKYDKYAMLSLVSSGIFYFIAISLSFIGFIV